eukprot:Nk52_evm28s211 gene=Nk52_evmTU28s211
MPKVNLIYGHSIEKLGKGEKLGPKNTHKWTVYVKESTGQSDLIRFVEFHLHESFSTPVRKITKIPFQVSEQGWGVFDINIRVHFKAPYQDTVVQMVHMVTFPAAGQSRHREQHHKVHFLSGGGGGEGGAVGGIRTQSPLPPAAAGKRPPTPDVLRMHIRDIVNEIGVRVVTSKQIRSALKARLKIDVDAQKTALKALCRDVIAKMLEEGEAGAGAAVGGGGGEGVAVEKEKSQKSVSASTGTSGAGNSNGNIGTSVSGSSSSSSLAGTGGGKEKEQSQKKRGTTGVQQQQQRTKRARVVAEGETEEEEKEEDKGDGVDVKDVQYKEIAAAIGRLEDLTLLVEISEMVKKESRSASQKLTVEKGTGNKASLYRVESGFFVFDLYKLKKKTVKNIYKMLSGVIAPK